MLLEEYHSTYNTENFHLISMPSEKFLLNYYGFPLIVQNLYDLITNYVKFTLYKSMIIENQYSVIKLLFFFFIVGLFKCLFDEVYSCNELKKNMNAHELVSNLKHSCKSIIEVDAKDVSIVLYYLPQPLISKKKMSLICGN